MLDYNKLLSIMANDRLPDDIRCDAAQRADIYFKDTPQNMADFFNRAKRLLEVLENETNFQHKEA